MGSDSAATERSRPLSICTIADLILDVIVLPRTAELARHGVEIRGPIAHGRGGIVVSLRDTTGHRMMASDRGVAADLDPSELDPSWMDGCDLLHVSGYCLLRAAMAEATIASAQLAPRVSVDLACAHHIALVGARPFTARLRALNPEVTLTTERASRRHGLRHNLGAQARRARSDVPRGLLSGPTRHGPRHDQRRRRARGRVSRRSPEPAIDAAARCVGVIGAMPPDGARRTA